MAWPTTDDPRTVFVTVRFTQSEADDMDTYLPGGRSDSVRDAVSRAVAIEKRRLTRKRLVAGEEVNGEEVEAS